MNRLVAIESVTEGDVVLHDGRSTVASSGSAIETGRVPAGQAGDCTTDLDTGDGVIVNFTHGNQNGTVVADPMSGFGPVPSGQFGDDCHGVGATVIEIGESATIGGVTITVDDRDDRNRTVVFVSGEFTQPIPERGVVVDLSAVFSMMSARAR